MAQGAKTAAVCNGKTGATNMLQDDGSLPPISSNQDAMKEDQREGTAKGAQDDATNGNGKTNGSKVRDFQNMFAPPVDNNVVNGGCVIFGALVKRTGGRATRSNELGVKKAMGGFLGGTRTGDLCACGKDLAACGACKQGWAQRSMQQVGKAAAHKDAAGPDGATS